MLRSPRGESFGSLKSSPSLRVLSRPLEVDAIPRPLGKDTVLRPPKGDAG